MKITNNQIREEDLEKIEELLVDIDMIYGFVLEGNLAAPSIMKIVPFHQELLEEHLQKPNAINVFGNDEHPEDAIEFLTFGVHSVKGTKEGLVIPDLQRWLESGLEFKKNSTNLMLAPGFIELLEKLPNLKKIKFIGCLSEVCVKNAAITARNYFDQVNRNVEVSVYAYGIDTYDAKGHSAEEVTERALEDMAMNGVKVLKREKTQNIRGGTNNGII